MWHRFLVCTNSMDMLGVFTKTIIVGQTLRCNPFQDASRISSHKTVPMCSRQPHYPSSPTLLSCLHVNNSRNPSANFSLKVTYQTPNMDTCPSSTSRTSIANSLPNVCSSLPWTQGFLTSGCDQIKILHAWQCKMSGIKVIRLGTNLHTLFLSIMHVLNKPLNDSMEQPFGLWVKNLALLFLSHCTLFLWSIS